MILFIMVKNLYKIYIYMEESKSEEYTNKIDYYQALDEYFTLKKELKIYLNEIYQKKKRKNRLKI